MFIETMMYQIKCDGCGEELDALWRESKRECLDNEELEDWVLIEDKELHYCPDCINKLKDQ